MARSGSTSSRTAGDVFPMADRRPLALPRSHRPLPRQPRRRKTKIVYVAMLEDGSQHSYTPAEFAEKFGWKNAPEKATLLQLTP